MSAILVLDAASPVVSVAVGDGGRVTWRTLELRRSSELLLAKIEEALSEAGRELGELAGIVVLQGPGSFTGLRIGLATVLGFHQALGIAATALPTLPVLAAAAAGAAPPNRVVTAVDALRGDWYVQCFRVPGAAGWPEATGQAGLCSGEELAELAPRKLVGFGIGSLADEPWVRERSTELVEPPPLAGVAARIVSADDPPAVEWDPSRLTQPIYFRPPAVTVKPQP